MSTPWKSAPLLLVIAGLVTASRAPAQSLPETIPSWHYWITAGGGFSDVIDDPMFLGEGGSALVGGATVQHRSLVASARVVRTDANHVAAWDAGLLAGIGSNPALPFRGSIAAGIGRIENARGAAGLTLPVELQLGCRLGSSVGLGVYAFGSFGGPADFLGATLALQFGRLR
jgi:hypothetical protein